MDLSQVQDKVCDKRVARDWVVKMVEHLCSVRDWYRLSTRTLHGQKEATSRVNNKLVFIQ